MRTVLNSEIKKERCNAAALGLYNASVSDDVFFTTNKNENLKNAEKFLNDEGFKVVIESFKNSNAAAIYNNSTDVIHLNKSNKFWKDPAKSMNENFNVKYLSSNSQKHILHHEIAHGKYSAPDNFFNNNEREIIGKEVSKYARMNPKEFVSEVYAATKANRKFSPEIMRLYKNYARPKK